MENIKRLETVCPRCGNTGIMLNNQSPCTRCGRSRSSKKVSKKRACTVCGGKGYVNNNPEDICHSCNDGKSEGKGHNSDRGF